MAIPDPTFEETNLILSVAGDSVGVGCSGGGSIPVHILRGASGPPLFFAVHRQGLAEQIGAPPVPAGITFGGPAGTYSITIREASGRVTQLDMTGFYQANAFGGPEDCFAQGTIKRFG